MTALGALFAALAVGLWCARPARASDRVRPQAPAGVRRRPVRRGATSADPIALALAVDLTAACLEAGVPLPAALAAGASVADPVTAQPLASMATALRRGGDAEAWAGCEGEPRLAPIARICRRVSTTGAAAGDDLRRLAAELRRAHQAERRRRSQRAAVWVVLPLGLCFLPAFLLLTVLPVVTALLPGLG